VLGFDVFVDSLLQPHLIEINTNPDFSDSDSAASEADVRRRVKLRVIESALELAVGGTTAGEDGKSGEDEVGCFSRVL
jgi:hypothetical protein